MARLIDAEALRNNLSSRKMTELYPNWREMKPEIREKVERLAHEFRFALDNAPTIDAEPVRHGHFGFVGLGEMRVETTFGTCSNCKERIGWHRHNNYCPNCGAKMDGGK